MNARENDILQQIANDPFVQACWKIRVAWFLIRLVAVVLMLLYVVVKNA